MSPGGPGCPWGPVGPVTVKPGSPCKFKHQSQEGVHRSFRPKANEVISHQSSGLLVLLQLNVKKGARIIFSWSFLPVWN